MKLTFAVPPFHPAATAIAGLCKVPDFDPSMFQAGDIVAAPAICDVPLHVLSREWRLTSGGETELFIRLA